MLDKVSYKKSLEYRKQYGGSFIIRIQIKRIEFRGSFQIVFEVSQIFRKLLIIKLISNALKVNKV